MVGILITEVRILSMASIVQVTDRNSNDKWCRKEEKKIEVAGKEFQ